MISRQIAFVGLGIMGRPMAMNLLRAGHSLFVYARRAEALRALTAAGATPCQTLAEAARQASVCISMVGDTNDVEAVVFAEHGLASGMRAGTTLIDMSTIHPHASMRMAEKMSARGLEMLDAPVSGGEQGAIEGKLSIMVGGRRAAFASVTDILRCLGEHITYVGAAGAGQIAKACNQLLVAQTMVAVAEAFEIARAAGVDAHAVRAALLGGFAGSRILQAHGRRMLEGDWRPGFKAELHLKDMNIVRDTAQALGVQLQGADAARRHLQQLLDEGEGQLDSSAIAKIVHKKSRLEPLRGDGQTAKRTPT